MVSAMLVPLYALEFALATAVTLGIADDLPFEHFDGVLQVSTSSRMIVTEVALFSISMGTSLPIKLILPKRGQSHHLLQIRAPCAALVIQVFCLLALTICRDLV